MAFLANALRHVFVLVALVAASAPLSWAVTPIGKQVVNIAEISYDHSSGIVTMNTNPAVFTVVARATPSTIEFFRYAPNAADAVAFQLNGSDYSPSGDAAAGDFRPIGPPLTMGGEAIATDAPVPLVPANTFFTGELFIIRVIDAGQNGDPTRIETVSITIHSDDGDLITMRLYETGPDTGEFMAWVPSTGEAARVNDPVLTATKKSQLVARYVDSFDAVEVTVDTALVDPFGRLFDSLTGELIDGATVSIVDALTGAPAPVFGIDGRASYPSSLISGDSVTDSSGRVYDLEPGEFLFPLMPPGDYRLEIAPPDGYAFPSGLPPEAFAGLENAPFEIIDGSYGGSFAVTASGPLNLDIPLDTDRGLTVTKSSGQAVAAIGDFITYTVQIENHESGFMPLRVHDELPRGMRYVPGSAATREDAEIAETVSPDGATVTFDLGRIAPGETVELSYVLVIGPGTPLGTAVNAAQAVNPLGAALSNRAEAAIRIQEDLLRSRSTLIGRVAEAACDETDDWARPVSEGLGVAGVRLYLETGDYAVTDADGLYHFEGLEEGTHIVQIDMETLPAGYEPMVCEENSRYAGSATSKFVDVRGGVIWRANFYLKKVHEGAALAIESRAYDPAAYRAFDVAWLDAADKQAEWAYPAPGESPAQPSVNFGLKLPFDADFEVTLNGRPIPPLNTEAKLTSTDGSRFLYRWRGVDIVSGRNLLRAVVTHRDGRVETLEREVWFVATPDRIRLVDDQSVLVADGRTYPVIAVRLEDSEGRGVHPGRVVEVDVDNPYRLRAEAELEGSAVIDRAEVAAAGVTVGRDGVAYIELEPTLETGRVRVSIPVSGGRVQTVSAYLRPENRDWIVVALAEGELGYVDSDAQSPLTEAGLYEDGRLALFAKGMIRGDWLLTLAIDTAKRRGARDDVLFDEIDPDAYYTLYGDLSEHRQDAASQYPVYVKLERGTTQLLFGDFNTDLRDSRLSEYSRQLSGLRAVHDGEIVSYTAFAAQTNQGFALDEIAADGTSGPYRLAQAPIVRSSEIITIETRDRTRPDEVVKVRTLTRYIDYEIDYETGELLFRAPVDATDSAFNDNVIVVTYEAVGDAERNLTYGGRAALSLGEDRAEIGLSHIREEGSDDSAGAGAELTGIDLRVEIDERTELHAEYATSTRRPGKDGGEEDSGDAWLLEAIHARDAFTLVAYARKQEAGFGLGQQGTNTAGITRYGSDLVARIGGRIDPDTGTRQTRSLRLGGYTEELDDDSAERSVGELTVQQVDALSTASLGLRSVGEVSEAGPRESVLAIANYSRLLPEWGVTLIAAHEAPLGNENADEVSLFPARTQVGIDKQLTRRATLNLRHERLDGLNASGENTTAGITVQPWIGSRVALGVNQITQDSSARLAATVGLDQTVLISAAWSASFGMANRSRISGEGEPADPFADGAVSPLAEGVRSPLTLDESYTSGYAGLGYRTEAELVSLRAEYRETASSNRWAAILGGAREVSRQYSYAGSARYQTEDRNTGGRRSLIDARLGTAWRPRDNGPALLNRLDLAYSDQEGGAEQWKLVNNLAVNAMASDATQVAGFWGLKYAEADLAGTEVSGLTHLLGGEIRHDLTERVDIGLRGLVMHGEASGTTEYSIGPSVGFSPVEGAWISTGYNLTGFADRDFEAAEYADHGAFVKLRMKFDQHDLADFLRQISP